MREENTSVISNEAQASFPAICKQELGPALRPGAPKVRKDGHDPAPVPKPSARAAWGGWPPPGPGTVLGREKALRENSSASRVGLEWAVPAEVPRSYPDLLTPPPTTCTLPYRDQVGA